MKRLKKAMALTAACVIATTGVNMGNVYAGSGKSPEMSGGVATSDSATDLQNHLVDGVAEIFSDGESEQEAEHENLPVMVKPESAVVDNMDRKKITVKFSADAKLRISGTAISQLKIKEGTVSLKSVTPVNDLISDPQNVFDIELEREIKPREKITLVYEYGVVKGNSIFVKLPLFVDYKKIHGFEMEVDNRVQARNRLGVEGITVLPNDKKTTSQLEVTFATAPREELKKEDFTLSNATLTHVKVKEGSQGKVYILTIDNVTKAEQTLSTSKADYEFTGDKLAFNVILANQDGGQDNGQGKDSGNNQNQGGQNQGEKQDKDPKAPDVPKKDQGKGDKKDENRDKKNQNKSERSGSARSSVRPDSSSSSKNEMKKDGEKKDLMKQDEMKKDEMKNEPKKDEMKTDEVNNVTSTDKVSTKLVIGQKTYTAMVNGQAIEKTMDVAPMVHQGRTVLPARMISELLGVDVKFDQKSKTANFMYGEAKVQLTLGQKFMLVNGEKVALTADILNKDGRILLPVTDIQKAFAKLGLEANVSWDAATKSVTIEK